MFILANEMEIETIIYIVAAGLIFRVLIKQVIKYLKDKKQPNAKILLHHPSKSNCGT